MTATERRSMFSERQVSLAIVVVVFAAVVLGGAVTWWRDTSLDPTRVFWGTVANGLATPGVTVSESVNLGGATTSQTTQFDFGPTKRAQTITSFSQDGAEVQTLELSTPTADFTKYIAIHVGAAKAAGKLNLANVLNVWGDTSGATKSKDAGLPSAFGTALPSLAAPFGNFAPAQQAALMDQIQTQQVYTPLTGTVQKHTVRGRLQYVYNVTIQPILFVQMMKSYAQATGLHELDSVNPNTYASDSATTMQWTVDARARQLVSISYKGHLESYSGYGLRIATPTPAAQQVIAGTALQARVNALNAALK